MLQAVKRRLQGEREEGFTLIELMVVVLIIAILIAIAIPTFLGARKRAQDRAAQSNLRNALTAEKTFYTDQQAYAPSGAALQGIEKSLTFQAGAADASKNQVQVEVGDVAVGDSNVVCLSSKSAAGNTYVLADIASGASAGTYYASAAAAACDVATVSAMAKDSKTGWTAS